MFDANNRFYGNNNGMAGTWNYNPNVQQMSQPKVNNILSAEQISKLMKTSEQFSINLTEDEVLRAQCNHRNVDGTGDMLTMDPLTGRAKCMICGYEFLPADANTSPDKLNESVSTILDYLQTIKIMYLDLPAEAAKEYFQIIPLIEKMPKLFEYAAKNFLKHEQYGNWSQNRNMGVLNMFNNLSNIFGNPAGMAGNMGGMAPNPNYGAPAGMPTGTAAPNAFGYPGASFGAAPMNNGAMGNPVLNNGGYNAQPNGFQFVPPTAPSTTVAPTAPIPSAPATTETATVTQAVTV